MTTNHKRLTSNEKKLKKQPTSNLSIIFITDNHWRLVTTTDHKRLTSNNRSLKATYLKFEYNLHQLQINNNIYI